MMTTTVINYSCILGHITTTHYTVAAARATALYYDGRLINKLQNSVILLVFQILKIQNMRFIQNLILNSICVFCADDVIVTSFINIKYGEVAIEIIS